MPLIKSNVHTHTTFCDGKDSMEDMTRAAVAVGMDTLGFSFHSFTPFDPTYCIRDYYAYICELKCVRAAYADKICVLDGVELDLYGERPSVCDYVIGSVHYLKEEGHYYPVDLSARGLRKIIGQIFRGDAFAAAERYFEEVGELAEKIRPDIYGHFDLITRFNADGSFFDEGAPRYKKAALAAADRLPDGAVVEINLGRLFKGEGGMYPSEWLIPELRARGGRFMLSSDAHCVQAIGYAFDETCEKLKKLGVRSLVRYKGKELVETEI